MPPTASGPPTNGERRAGDAVRALAGRSALNAPASAVASVAEVTAPLACYWLDSRHFDEPDPLAGASLTGWRYLVVGGGFTSMADFPADDDTDDLDPVVIGDPETVRGIIAAGHRGEAHMARQDDGEYDVRLLSTFAGPERWLWFHRAMVPYGNEDIMVSLDPEAPVIRPAVEFVAELAELAELAEADRPPERERGFGALSIEDETGG